MKSLFFIAIICCIGLFNSAANSGIDERDPKKPIIGLGSGLFTFQGDVGPNSLQAAFRYQLGYHLDVEKNIIGNFNIGTILNLGKLRGEERTAERNLNFKTTFFSEVLYLTYYYNMNKEFSKLAFLSPFASAGIGFLTFKPMGDLYGPDTTSNPSFYKYYYWSDGSVRSKAEPDTTAIFLVRDHDYETDLRKADIDGFGNYSLFSFQIPFSMGTQITISNKFRVKIGLAYHFTFTDNIDNITDKSINGHEIFGNRQGNKSKDKYFHSFVTLQYDLAAPKYEPQDGFKDPYLAVIDERDNDHDGIPDFLDECPHTPKGIIVDKKGCPLDTDNDGIPDYLDKETKTAKTALVDLEGKEITKGSGLMIPIRRYELSVSDGDTSIIKDDETEQGWTNIKAEEDSSHSFSDVKDTTEKVFKISAEKDDEDSLDKAVIINTDPSEKTKKDTLGAKIVGNIEKADSLNDQLITSVDSSIKQKTNTDLATEEKNIGETQANQTTLQDAGTNDKKEEIKTIVLNEQPVKTNVKKQTNQSVSSIDYKDYKKIPNGLFYTVQVGAFQNEVPLEKVTTLLNMEGIYKILSPDSLTIFNVGEFKNVKDAEKLYDIIKSKGFKDAFVAAYQDGKRITVQEAKKITAPIISLGEQLVVKEISEPTITTIRIPDNETIILETKETIKPDNKIELNVGTQFVVTAQPKNDSIPVTLIDENIAESINISLPKTEIDASIGKINKGDMVEITEITHDSMAVISKIVGNTIEKISTIPIKQLHAVINEMEVIPPVSIGDTLKIVAVDKENRLDITNKSLEGSTVFSATSEEIITKDKKSEELIKKYKEMPTLEESKNIVESGVIIKVQVGAFRYAVPLKLLNLFLNLDIKNVVYYLNPADSITRFNTGSFKSYKDANNYKTEIKSKGVQDAFLVAFKNGKKITLEEALAELQQPLTVQTTLKKSEENITQTQDNNTNLSSGLVFKIQIGAYQNDTPIDLFQKIEAINSEKGPNGFTRYTAGAFRSSEAAQLFKNDVVSKGVKDAFIVSYNNGTRIPINQAVNLLNNLPNETRTDYEKIILIELQELRDVGIYEEKYKVRPVDTADVSEKINFKVQVGVFRSGVPSEIWEIFQKINPLKSHTSTDSLTVYTSGSFQTYQEANKHKANMIELGIKDAFITAYINTRIISIQEAMALSTK